MGVPAYTGQRVSPAALPGVRVTDAAPAAAFAPPKQVDLSGVADVYAQRAQEERDQADQMAINSVQVQLGNLRTDLMTKATSAVGHNALQAASEVAPEWDKGVAKILEGPYSDRVKQRIQMHAAGFWANLHEAVETHAAAQVRKQDNTETTELLQRDLDAANKDPFSAEQSAERAAALTRELGKRNGWSDIQTQNAVARNVSNLHASAISRWVEQGTLGSAQIAQNYLDVHKDELYGQQLNDAEQQVERALSEGAGVQEAARIMTQQDETKQPKSRTQALAEAEAIEDPKQRKAAVEALIAHYNHQERVQHLDRQDALTEITKGLEATGGRLNRASAAWRLIEGAAEGEHALAEQKRILHPPPDPGNPDLFLQQLSMASISDESRQQFAQEDILKLPGLNTAQRTHLLTLQRQFSVHDERAGDTDVRRNIAAAEAEARYYRHQAEQFALKNDTEAAAVALRYQHSAEETARSLRGDELSKPETIPFHDFGKTSVRVGTDKPLLTPVLPVVHPTQEMLDGAARNPKYAEYLRSMNVALPKTLRIIPPTPTPAAKP